MKETALCYIENDGYYLMMHRTKKKNDENLGKWIGIGGKLENEETPAKAALREISEETGLSVKNLKYRGRVYFKSDIWDDELMHLFTAYSNDRNHISCDEGELEWVDKEAVMSLNLWEGDKVFLELLLKNKTEFFEIVLNYKGDTLVDYAVKDIEYEC